MYCIVDQRVAVETAETGHGVVGVVTDATVIKQEIKKTQSFSVVPFLIFRNFSRSSSRTSGLLIESDPILLGEGIPVDYPILPRKDREIPN